MRRGSGASQIRAIIASSDVPLTAKVVADRYASEHGKRLDQCLVAKLGSRGVVNRIRARKEGSARMVWWYFTGDLPEGWLDDRLALPPESGKNNQPGNSRSTESRILEHLRNRDESLTADQVAASLKMDAVLVKDVLAELESRDLVHWWKTSGIVYWEAV
ncbi:hypothetical protein KQI63_15765 [bacterium]|nr:hypothetical protein [bacterium]